MGREETFEVIKLKIQKNERKRIKENLLEWLELQTLMVNLKSFPHPKKVVSFSLLKNKIRNL